MRAVAPEVPGSTATPGTKWSTALDTGSIGTRTGAAHVLGPVDLASTMSLLVHPVRNRQSAQVTYTMPAPSTAAEGSGDSRSDPATPWCLMLETRTVAPQEAPPLVLLNERISPLAQDSKGTTTVPLGCTTGCPPSPVAPPLGARAGPQVRPPSVEVFIITESPALVTSYSVDQLPKCTLA